MNLYAYVGNDPVNKWDPTGLETTCDDAGSCKTEDGTEIVNISGIEDDALRAKLADAINNLSNKGDWEKQMLDAIKGANGSFSLSSGDVTEIRQGLNGFNVTINSDDIGSAYLVGRGKEYNALMRSSASGKKQVMKNKMQNSEGNFFLGRIGRYSPERIIRHETEHAFAGHRATNIYQLRLNEAVAIRATNRFMWDHFDELPRSETDHGAFN